MTWSWTISSRRKLLCPPRPPPGRRSGYGIGPRGGTNEVAVAGVTALAQHRLAIAQITAKREPRQQTTRGLADSPADLEGALLRHVRAAPLYVRPSGLDSAFSSFCHFAASSGRCQLV